MHEDAYQCEVGSEIFRRVCVELNSTRAIERQSR